MSIERRTFLDPTILARIGNLELIAKFVVEGFISGLHKSPYHGFSVEFSQYRQYMPGDDTKHIDWKAYARTDRYYIKQFEEETNLNCYLLLDASESMLHPIDDAQVDDPTMEEGGTGKDYRSYDTQVSSSRPSPTLWRNSGMRLVLRTLMIRFASTFLPGVVQSHLHSILLTLETLQTARSTRMGTPLHQIAERLTKRGLVLFVSDLYDENHAEVVEGLEHLRYEGHEVIVFHVLAHQELEFADFEAGRSTRSTYPFY